jgi:hypothetical protein
VFVATPHSLPQVQRKELPAVLAVLKNVFAFMQKKTLTSSSCLNVDAFSKSDSRPSLRQELSKAAAVMDLHY